MRWARSLPITHAETSGNVRSPSVICFGIGPNRARRLCAKKTAAHAPRSNQRGGAHFSDADDAGARLVFTLGRRYLRARVDDDQDLSCENSLNYVQRVPKVIQWKIQRRVFKILISSTKESAVGPRWCFPTTFKDVLVVLCPGFC